MAIEQGGPADQAGILEEDVIVALGEKPVASVDDLHRLLTELPIGVPASVVLLRGPRQLERLGLPQGDPHPAPPSNHRSRLAFLFSYLPLSPPPLTPPPP